MSEVNLHALDWQSLQPGFPECPAHLSLWVVYGLLWGPEVQGQEVGWRAAGVGRGPLWAVAPVPFPDLSSSSSGPTKSLLGEGQCTAFWGSREPPQVAGRLQ